MERVESDFGCVVVSAWEERIWLDRREIACLSLDKVGGRGVLARLAGWMRCFRSRMQLGPVGDDGWK
jgi:hypothetical protein